MVGLDGKAGATPPVTEVRSLRLDLPALAIKVFDAIGALVEEGEDGTLEVLIPEPYQGRLDGADFLRLATAPDVAVRTNAQLLAIGSPIVDQIAALAEEVGRTTRWYVEGLRLSRRHAINLERWSVRFAGPRIRAEGDEVPFASHILVLNFQVSYLSDERREELRTITLDTLTRQRAPLFEQLWRRAPVAADGIVYVPDELRPPRATWPEPISLALRPAHHLIDEDRLPTRPELAELEKRAVRELQSQIAPTVDGYRRRTKRLAELEQARINVFFDDTEEELTRRLNRAETEERRNSIAAKLEVNRLDRLRKLADLEAKNRLQVIVRLINAAIVTQPKIRTLLSVESRRATVTLPVIFDPLTGEIELPSCQNCWRPMTLVHLQVDGRLVCPACEFSSGPLAYRRGPDI
jgi:hypothetical protein